MTESSTFTCKNCGCINTKEGHFLVQIDKELGKREKKEEEEREQYEINQKNCALESNSKITEKLEKECSEHNSEWNGWKGRIFHWEISRKHESNYSSLHNYVQIKRWGTVIKSKLLLSFAGTHRAHRHSYLRYIECPVCKHREYFE